MKLVFNRVADPLDNLSTVMNIVGNTLYVYDYIVSNQGEEGAYENPNSVTSEEFLNTIRNMKGDIEVRINSKGGELSYALAVYNTLMEHEGKVTTIVDGYAYSCASWILLAGEDRQINAGGIVMVHNPVINATINSENAFDKIMPQWKASRDSIAGLISSRTGKQKDDVLNLMDAQTFMNADEAIKHGFCTSKRNGKASIPRGVGNYLPSEIRNAVPEVANSVIDLADATRLLLSKNVAKTRLTQ